MHSIGAAAASMAAPTPWAALEINSISSPVERPQASELSANTMNPMVKTRFSAPLSEILPKMRIRPARTIR